MPARRLLSPPARSLALALLLPLPLGAGFAALPAATASATTYTVTTLSDGFPGSLRALIAGSAAGDTIRFAPVTFQAGIVLTAGEIPITHDLTVLGLQADATTLNGDLNSRIFNVSAGSLTLANLTLFGARCPDGEAGGAILFANTSGTLTLRDCVIDGDLAGGNTIAGDGIAIGGTAVLDRCVITNCSSNGLGSGIYCPGHLTAHDCLFQNDGASTTTSGGALYVSGTAGLYGCTFTGNTGTNGAAVVVFSGSAYFEDCTITGNTPVNTFAVVVDGGTACTFANTIVDGNQFDVTGTVVSNGFNLVGTDGFSIGFSTTLHDQYGGVKNPLDAMLGALADHGGPTWTCAPLPGSPALDHGHLESRTTDARGHARKIDDPAVANGAGSDGTDVGAVEVGPARRWTVTNLLDAGPGSLRQATITAAPGDSILFGLGLAGTIPLTSGDLFVWRGMTILGPGAGLLSLDGLGARRVLDVLPGASGVDVRGLTFTDAGLVGACVQIDRSAQAALSFDAITNGACTGVANEGTLSLDACLVSGNSASLGGHAGGGVWWSGGGTISNTTIQGNLAPQGAGVYFVSGTVAIDNCTIAENGATIASGSQQGGGIFVSAGSPAVSSTVIEGNVAPGGGDDVFGAFTSQGYNFVRIGDGSTGFTNGVAQDQVGTAAAPLNAGLGALADNGGQTASMLPVPGSPLIDRGLNHGFGHDQRDDQRVVDQPSVPNAPGGDGCDIGAVEVGGVAVAVPTLPPGVAALSLRAAPNPSRADVQVVFELPRAGEAELAVYDVAGRLVRTLAASRLTAGAHVLTFDGRANGGGRLPPGAYWLRLRAPGGAVTRAIVLAR